MKKIDFEKYSDGLVPAIVQDAATQKVLMLGFMSDESYGRTLESGRITFYSRSKERLWQKGETSGNVLKVESILLDCDADTLLIKATPAGPVCHSGSETCFAESNLGGNFLDELEVVIHRRKNKPIDNSYTSELFASGLTRIAQKVGEEAVELILAAKDDDVEAFKSEAADLIYHLLVLLAEKNIAFADVADVLRSRSDKGQS